MNYFWTVSTPGVDSDRVERTIVANIRKIDFD